MAMLHHLPHAPARRGGKLHPAVYLAAGFAFIFGTAYAVHIVFNAVI
ncbi:hypothetical protein [Brevundimonas sp.]|nr:hypothetical protein [Brevundimonas sp.]MDZ4362792.1 hypothetical protein [Brevundimonas sp.]